ncbi:MAG TPA: tRNA (guanosine(46)-N7)-methyltransferase TrmB [Casimicrobiaceae bacterium]|jgi:tRNA (guanine-N7-)-methyltransferase
MRVDTTQEEPRKPIRSYVLRQGRLSPAQRRACDDLFPLYGVPFSTTVVDWAAIFGRVAPVVLEIGFGMGETTAAIADAHREMDFVAVDVHLPGIGALLNRIDTLHLTNVRVIRHDAVEVVSTMTAKSSLAAIHVYFPDPWPKKRHHKRRLLKPDFVHALAQRLVPRGYLHVATDWREYAEDVLATMSAEPLLVNTTAGFAERPQWRPLTKFEARGQKLGHEVFDLVFARS